MSSPSPTPKPGQGYAFNRTREAFLASELRVADTHLSRLIGLLFTPAHRFLFGQGLWITPCRGVHTLLMRYPIDVIYLDESSRVIHIEENVRPWRMTPVRLDSTSVLELPPHTIYNTGTRAGDAIEINFAGRNGDPKGTRKDSREGVAA